MCQESDPNGQESLPMAGHWVYIAIPSKTSRYTLFCEITDRPWFKNWTVHRYKPVSQSVIIVSELAITALADRPRRRGGPSAVQSSTPPETNIISGTTLKLAGGLSAPQERTVRRSSLKSARDNNVSGPNCQIVGGPSATQGRTVRSTDIKPNQRKHPLWYILS